MASTWTPVSIPSYGLNMLKHGWFVEMYEMHLAALCSFGSFVFHITK